jgi:hypothetical protein
MSQKHLGTSKPVLVGMRRWIVQRKCLIREASCRADQCQETRKAQLIAAEKSPFPVALFITFVYTGELEMEHVKTVWPTVYDLWKNDEDPDTFEITSLVQLYCLADEWMLPELRKMADIAIMSWRLGYASSDLTVIESMKTKEFNGARFAALVVQAVFDLVPEGDVMRTKAVVYGYQLTKVEDLIERYKAHYLSNKKELKQVERELEPWCNKIRDVLQKHAPVATDACRILHGK